MASRAGQPCGSYRVPVRRHASDRLVKRVADEEGGSANIDADTRGCAESRFGRAAVDDDAEIVTNRYNIRIVRTRSEKESCGHYDQAHADPTLGSMAKYNIFDDTE